MPDPDPMPDVRPVVGEILRYHVQSRSRPDIWHLVDLGERDGQAACGCEDAEFRGQQCWHITRAQKHFAITMARLIIELRRDYETSKTQTPGAMAGSVS